MGSPITFSGFNQIDFGIVLNAIMQQESQPLQALQSQQRNLQAIDSAFGQLATKLDALQNAASDLSSASSLVDFAATSSDTAAVSVSATESGVAGRYEVVVKELARAQVTASATTAPDTDTTVVATGGSLTIGGVSVAISGPVTLGDLADAINGASDAPATASVIETSPGAFTLVLTGKEAGEDNAFAVVNALTGSSITFADGDDNAVQASDASVLINNIEITSSSNTLETGIPGVSVTLRQKDPTKTVVVTVARDDQSVVDRVNTFVTAYNDVIKFADDQAAAAGKGSTGTLGRQTVLRTLRGALRSSLAASYGSGTYKRLAEIGLGFNRAGQLTLDQKLLAQAFKSAPSAVEQLFADKTTGAFKSIDGLITEYTQSGGFVPDARTRLSGELSRLGKRVDDMQARLAVRRTALQQEFIAADQAMSRLNGQSGSLASFGSSLTSSNIS